MRLAAADTRLGELIDTLDWARTPLGPMRSWRQSLRTSIDLCLASRFPIVLYWGTELVTIYNDAYAPILRSKHPSALGRPCREVWAEIWDVIGPMLTGVVKSATATWSDDMLLVLERRGYPEECYFSFSFTPVRGEDGCTDGVFTAVIETTARVVGERRLLTLRELGQHVIEVGSVEQACQRAARTISRNPDDLPFSSIYLLDADKARLNLIAASGVSIGRAICPAIIALDAPQETIVESVLRAVAGGAAERVELGHEYANQVPGGSSEVTAAMVLPIRRAGQTTAYGVLIAGISPRREFDEDYRGFYDLLADGVTTAVANARAYEEERARVEALAGIDRAKTAFFSNVSHEFRTPLTLMLGPLEELLRSSLPAGLHAELDMIYRNGLRLLKLVNALLDFSRIEADRAEAVCEPTDLATLTTDVAGAFRSAIEHAGLRLTVECESLPGPVHVDREMWEKIVLNLLSNAFKFTLQGEITVSVRPLDNGVQLTVGDTGVGVPSHELPHIFERFHRVKGSLARTHEGAGIGLSLVRELVALHRGTIRAESVEGDGTRVIVWIPRGSEQPTSAAVRGSRPLESTAGSARAYVAEAMRWFPEEGVVEPQGDPSTGEDQSVDRQRSPRPYIVCADDNADMRAYLNRLLSPHYDVETVADGDAALRAVRRRTPDLVVSDVMMPGVDGLGLLRALRDDPKTRLVPVVLLSARAAEQSRIDGLQSGADDYLVKPFSSREMLARVKAHLEIARMRKAILRKERAALVSIDASEAQRRRISRELHDELGQQLTAIVLGLRSMRDAVAKDGLVRSSLQRLEEMAVQASQDMHHIALELRPGALDDKGLQTALSNYVEEWSKRNDVGADVQYVGLGNRRLPSHVENTIYRIVQEALTNVGTHAKATAVSVIVQRQGDAVVAIVEDNGCGFDVTNTEGRVNGRLGLLGMRERAALVGGNCDIESHEGGTTVLARVPIQLDEQRDA
jgi:signal transduction histidine kinase/GAF domain-containing protein